MVQAKWTASNKACVSAFVAFMNMRHLRCSCSAWLRHWSVFCSWPPCARLLWIFFVRIRRKRQWTKATLLECQSSPWSIGTFLHGQKPSVEKSVPTSSGLPSTSAWKRRMRRSRMFVLQEFKRSSKKRDCATECQCNPWLAKGVSNSFSASAKMAFYQFGKASRAHTAAKEAWVHWSITKPNVCGRIVAPSGAGASLTPLYHQAAVLCCALAGVPVTSTPVNPRHGWQTCLLPESTRISKQLALPTCAWSRSLSGSVAITSGLM